MENEILLSDLLKLIKRNMKLILVLVIILILVSAFVTKFIMQPVYQASTQVLVNQKEESNQPLNVGEVQSNIQLVNTYRVIIKSPRILEEVQKDNPGYTVKQLNKSIDVNSEANSQVINITVKDTNASDAIKVANDTAKIFEKEIGKIMKVDNVSVLSKADDEMTEAPVSPKLSLNLAVAVVIAIILSFVIIFIRKAMDRTIFSETELVEFTGGTVLGSIRNISKKEIDRIMIKTESVEG